MLRVLTSTVVAVGLFVLAAVDRPVPAADAQGGLKVMTFNIQHGIDGSHKYNLQRAIDTIAKIRPGPRRPPGSHPESSVLQLRRPAGEDC